MNRALKKPEKVHNVHLTERDQMILRALRQFRFLTIDQIMMLTESDSRTKINDRLRQLWSADYIDRPEVQRQVYSHGDKRHTVQTLGPAGARWLTDTDGAVFPKGMSWKHANQLKDGRHLVHEIGVTDTMLRFRADLKLQEGYRLIYPDELLETAPGRQPEGKWAKPHRLPTILPTRDGRRMPRGTEPDFTFALGRKRGTDEKRALFFLEWDNATEDFVKRDVHQSSIASKYEAYTDVYRRRLHTEKYGFKGFRVLFVVNGPNDRITKMMNIYQSRIQSRCPAGAFLHASMEDVERHGPLGPIWRTGTGEWTPLVEQQ